MKKLLLSLLVVSGLLMVDNVSATRSNGNGTTESKCHTCHKPHRHCKCHEPRQHECVKTICTEEVVPMDVKEEVKKTECCPAGTHKRTVRKEKAACKTGRCGHEHHAHRTANA